MHSAPLNLQHLKLLHSSVPSLLSVPPLFHHPSFPWQISLKFWRRSAVAGHPGNSCHGNITLSGPTAIGIYPKGLGNVISSHCVLISPHSQTASVEWMYKCLVDGFLTLINRQGCLRASSDVYTANWVF